MVDDEGRKNAQRRKDMRPIISMVLQCAEHRRRRTIPIATSPSGSSARDGTSETCVNDVIAFPVHVPSEKLIVYWKSEGSGPCGGGVMLAPLILDGPV